MTAKTTPRIRSLRPYEMSDPHPLPAYGLQSTQRRLLMLTAGPLGFKPFASGHFRDLINSHDRITLQLIRNGSIPNGFHKENFV